MLKRDVFIPYLSFFWTKMIAFSALVLSSSDREVASRVSRASASRLYLLIFGMLQASKIHNKITTTTPMIIPRIAQVSNLPLLPYCLLWCIKPLLLSLASRYLNVSRTLVRVSWLAESSLLGEAGTRHWWWGSREWGALRVSCLCCESGTLLLLCSCFFLCGWEIEKELG